MINVAINIEIDEKSELEGYSTYARVFDDGCPNWELDPRSNRMYLQYIERNCNDLLKARGYLFLNEVYRMLGISYTKAGQVVGWLSDSTISFGLDKDYNERFMIGEHPVAILDFNVDGIILDKI